MRTRLFSSFLILIVFFAILWSGCNEKQKNPAEKFEEHPVYKHYRFSNDEKVIEIGAPTPWATVSHIIEVMKRDEILKEDLARTGYTVKFYPFLKGEEITYFMDKGALEGAVMGDVPTLKMAAEGRITVMSLFHKGSVALLSRDVYRVRDLKNKRVAYPYGSIAHRYLLELLKKNGMSNVDIRHVPMDTGDMFEAIEQKRLDALATFEPMATVYTRIDPTLHTISRSFSSYGFFGLRKEYADAHPRAARAIVAAQFRAIAWLKGSDRNLNRASRWVAEESAKIMALPLDAHITELDALCAEELLGNIIVYENLINQTVLGSGGEMKEEFEFLKQKGLIPQDREWKDVTVNVDTRALSDVLNGVAPPISRIHP